MDTFMIMLKNVLIFVLLVTMNLLQMRSEKKKNALYGKR